MLTEHPPGDTLECPRGEQMEFVIGIRSLGSSLEDTRNVVEWILGRSVAEALRAPLTAEESLERRRRETRQHPSLPLSLPLDKLAWSHRPLSLRCASQEWSRQTKNVVLLVQLWRNEDLRCR